MIFIMGGIDQYNKTSTANTTKNTVISPLTEPAITREQYQIGDTLPLHEESYDYHASSKVVDGYKEIAWESLVPANWDPMTPLKALNIDELDDNDPRAMKALNDALTFWADAPVNEEIAGKSIRIPGFVVILESHHQSSNEFLLVPYFGACIHTPPPPANQIIHVTTNKPTAHLKTMDTVWIHGQLNIERADTTMGKSGYSMQAANVLPYEY